VIALGDVSVTEKEITMTHTRYLSVNAKGHADIVSKALAALRQSVSMQQVDREAVQAALMIDNAGATLAANTLSRLKRADQAQLRSPWAAPLPTVLTNRRSFTHVDVGVSALAPLLKAKRT
jgi:hypothetical protein